MGPEEMSKAGNFARKKQHICEESARQSRLGPRA